MTMSQINLSHDKHEVSGLFITTPISSNYSDHDDCNQIFTT